MFNHEARDHVCPFCFFGGKHDKYNDEPLSEVRMCVRVPPLGNITNLLGIGMYSTSCHNHDKQGLVDAVDRAPYAEKLRAYFAKHKD